SVVQQRIAASRSKSVIDPTLNALARDLAKEMRSERVVGLRQRVAEMMPMTWGVLRPQILLPNGVEDWPEERQRVVITHEIAHVKRCDWFIQTTAQLVCAIYWFNPLFWLACRQLYRESEQACDDIVVRLGFDARDYASHLLHIARAFRRSR